MTRSSAAAVEQEPRYRRLRWFNLAMFALHLVQGIVMVLVSNDTTLPIMASFLELNPETGGLEGDPETLVDVRVGPIVAAFLFISAVAHLMLSLPGIYGWYVRNLERRINYVRWVEYSLSASLMIVIIAMLVGIYDIAALIAFFVLNAMMILCGWMMERWNQLTKRTDWTAFIFGCIAGIAPWIGIAIYLFGSGGGEGGPPDFVYWIFVSIFLFFNVFAINMVLQYAKIGPWRNYLVGEYGYIVLSLTAKSVLAWQVFAGTLQPN